MIPGQTSAVYTNMLWELDWAR